MLISFEKFTIFFVVNTYMFLLYLNIANTSTNSNRLQNNLNLVLIITSKRLTIEIALYFIFLFIQCYLFRFYSVIRMTGRSQGGYQQYSLEIQRHSKCQYSTLRALQGIKLECASSSLRVKLDFTNWKH